MVRKIKVEEITLGSVVAPDYFEGMIGWGIIVSKVVGSYDCKTHTLIHGTNPENGKKKTYKVRTDSEVILIKEAI